MPNSIPWSSRAEYSHHRFSQIHVETVDGDPTSLLESDPAAKVNFNPAYQFMPDSEGGQPLLGFRLDTQVSTAVGSVSVAIEVMFRATQPITNEELDAENYSFMKDLGVPFTIPFVRDLIWDLTTKSFPQPLMIPVDLEITPTFTSETNAQSEN